MDRLSFEALLDRYLTGDLSAEDRNRLAAEIEQPEHAVELEDFVRDRMLSDDFLTMGRSEGVMEGLSLGQGGVRPGVKEAILTHWENSREHTKNDEGQGGEWAGADTVRPVRRIDIRRYVAAAVFFLALATGILTWRTMKEKKPVAAIPTPATDVAPGHDGAILTLADGRSIVLDSSRDGSLALQGNTMITKQGAGQLVYRAGAAAGGATGGGTGESAATGTAEAGSAGVAGTQAVSEIMYNTLTTPRGRRTSVVLPDGTKVWLNSASSIKFPTVFSGKERIVQVMGQAYFEVAKDAAKPFKVKVLSHTAPEQITRELEIEVLGTSFDLMGYNDEETVRATLVDGSVSVRAVNFPGRKVLKPGEQVAAGGDGQLNLKTSVDVQKVTAWKDGNFLFREDDLGSIMKELSRWYDIDVHFEGSIKDHYTGTISRQVNISQVLKMLEAAGGVSFTVKDRQVQVLPHTM
jgi:ferric-dicitrate binding protein FerR (iron transport regulator)